MKLRALWYAVAGLVWASVPMIASAAIVPCGLNGDAAATCNICTFGQLVQNIINFAIGLSIPLAAVLFAYAGWLYFSNRENTSQIEKAHSIFRSVFIGFCIAVAGWLIVQTILKTLAPGYQSWTTFSCTANRPMNANIGDLFKQSGLPGLAVTGPPLGNQNYGGPINTDTGCNQGDYLQGEQCLNSFGGTYPPSNGSGPLGPTNNDIAAAATNRFNDDTSSGPGGGNVACAWEVNRVLQDAGIPPVDANLVSDMEQQLRDEGRGTPVDIADARAGDIVIWKTDTVSHVGICYNSDCTQVISNSSGDASFNNFSGTTFLGVPGRIYRVNR